jgi:ABC-type multidrug transport system fused ATPase/permease subunit
VTGIKAEPRSTFGKILSLLTPRERKQGLLVLGLMLVTALLDTAGVASIMPFLAVLGNPELIRSNQALGWLYRRGGFESVNGFLFALGAGAFLMVIFSAALRIAGTYATNRYIQTRRYTIGARLLEAYLRQPYEFFLSRNSADLSKIILSEVDQVVTSVLQPLLNTMSYGLVVAALLVLLVLVSPGVALVASVVVGGAYGGIYRAVRTKLRAIGHDRVTANRERYVAASEAFGGIKDLKVLGREEAYLSRFRGPAARFSRAQAAQASLWQVPRFLIEAIGFGGLLILALALLGSGMAVERLLPVLGLYAFAGYRVLPAAQQMFAGVSQVRYGMPALDEIRRDLLERRDPEPSKGPSRRHPPLGEGIRFVNVWYRYPGAAAPALRGLNLAIPAGSSVGFVGATGAGKTTAVDLILGLLRPSSGHILLDGEPLGGGNVRAWQRSIGYVPQQIYLADATIAENIAFGIRPDQVDRKAVEEAARAARLHDFVERLPQGYATLIGERGVRLSGGERQRVGIARALYHRPSVLILDEATSALDLATEKAVMASVAALTGSRTVIIVAHRLSTVERCDTIVVLENGEIRGEGRFAELYGGNSAFRRVAVA